MGTEEIVRQGSAAVDVAAVADADHQNQEHLVFNLVDDAILTDPDAVALFLSLEFLDTHRPRGLRELIDGGPDPLADGRFKLAEIP